MATKGCRTRYSNIANYKDSWIFCTIVEVTGFLFQTVPSMLCICNVVIAHILHIQGDEEFLPRLFLIGYGPLVLCARVHIKMSLFSILRPSSILRISG